MGTRSQPCNPNRLALLLDNQLTESVRQDVEAHLLVCPACRDKLDELAGGPRWWPEVRRYLAGDGASALSRAVGPAAPRQGAGIELDFLQPSDNPAALGRLGAYEVLDIVGRGGMGVVLRGFDPALHRTVAIKVMAAAYASNGPARQRFVREARAAAAVAHEHVVPVYAVDADTALPYFAMAFVTGQSLQQRIDRSGPLELKEILRIGMQTAAGLAAAHAQGLVHRDIKPANIMLENGIEQVRITDFGLARAVADAALTQSGVVAGTPQYMAPEQARGEAVDHRADLFSLGSTVYAMCTGHPPFRADSAVAVLRRVSDDEPRPVRELNAEVPSWLATLIGRLHAKDPKDRIQTAAELAELLGQCLAHVQQPLAVPLPPSLVNPAARARSPRRLPRATLALLSLVAIAGVLSFWAWQHWRNEVPLDDAVVPGTSAPSGIRRGALRNQADEIDEQLRTLNQEVDSCEADIVRWKKSVLQDSFSQRVRRLLEEASFLERQILPAAGTRTDRFFQIPSKGDDP